MSLLFYLQWDDRNEPRNKYNPENIYLLYLAVMLDWIFKNAYYNLSKYM